MDRRLDSVEEINVKFLQILHKLGMDSTSKTRLSQKLSLEAKMNMIVSIQSQNIKEQNLKNSLIAMRCHVSLYHLYLIKSTVNQGPQTLYDVIKKNDGIEIIENCIELILYYECVKEANFELNKSLYEQNSECRENFDPAVYGNERKIMYTTYNASKVVFSEYSREYVLDEHLSLILTILKNYKEALRDFKIEKITRMINLHKCYTKVFYDILDYYASNDLSLLDFLFGPMNSCYHLCLVNTFFYDIYKDDLKYTAVEIMRICEKYQKFIFYAMDQIRIEDQMGEKLTDSQTKGRRMNFLEILNPEDKDKQSVNRDMIKLRINSIIDSLANSTAANTIPCLVESFLTNPEYLSGKSNEVKLLGEIEKLKKENERLQIAVVNMDNKKDTIDKEIKQVPIVKKSVLPNIKEVVTKKMNEVTIRKPPPFAKKKIKEVNPTLAPYFKRSYYPLRWAKMCKGNNVWDEVNDTMNVEEILGKFTIDNLFCYEKKIVVTEKVTKTVSRVLTVLPGKKGNAISIALGRLHINDSDFKKMILDYDTSIINENMAKQLIANYPTPDEFKQLQVFREEGYDEDSQRIGRAEEFYLNFIEHEEEFLEKLKAVYFKLIYPILSSSIRRNMKRTSKVYNTALQSKSIREFLQISLLLGNVFNGSTFIGNAEGFTLESLYQFINYKGNDKEQLIVDIVNKMQHSLINDLTLITQESIKYESVCTEIADLNMNFDRLKNLGDLKLLWPVLFSDHSQLLEEIKNYNWLYGKFCKYFGEGNIFEIFKAILDAIVR